MKAKKQSKAKKTVPISPNLTVEIEPGPTAHADFGDLGQPLRSIRRRIDMRPCTGNSPTPVEGFQPAHNSGEVAREREISACQLPQFTQPHRPYSRFAHELHRSRAPLHFVHHRTVQLRDRRVELIEQCEQILPTTVGPPIEHEAFQFHARAWSWFIADVRKRTSLCRWRTN